MSLIRLRGGTEYEWTTADPVLRAREVGVTTDTYRLKVGDGYLAWSELPWVDQAGQSLAGAVAAVTESSELDSTDYVVLADGTITITLPTAVYDIGRTYIIKNVGTGLVTVTGTETIDGQASQLLRTKDAITVMSDDTEWVIL